MALFAASWEDVLIHVSPSPVEREDIKESESAKETVADTREAEARAVVIRIPAKSFL
jgi:hypothetical protein